MEIEEYISTTRARSPSFVIQVGVLHKTISAVKSATETRTTIPILGGVIIRIADGRLTATATDMEIVITKTVDANVQAGGVFVVNAAALGDILARLPADGMLTASIEGESLVARCGRSRVSLPTLPVEDFPAVVGRGPSSEIVVGARELGLALAKVAFAMASEATRPYLCGVYMHSPDGSQALRFAATTGMVLATVAFPLRDGAAFDSAIILPRRSAALLRPHLSDADADVRIATTETTARFTVGDTVILSKLIDGTYPEYQRVIPREVDEPFHVVGGQMRRAINLAAGISSDNAACPVKLEITSQSAVVSSPRTSPGEATTELDAGDFEYSGEPKEVALGSKQLDPVLSALSGDPVFHIKTGMDTVLVKDAADPSASYVLQPFRI